jgi:hypothetical protein
MSNEGDYNRLIVGLITPHCTYLTIMKPVREAKARLRAVVSLMMMMAVGVRFHTLIHDYRRDAA